MQQIFKAVLRCNRLHSNDAVTGRAPFQEHPTIMSFKSDWGAIERNGHSKNEKVFVEGSVVREDFPRNPSFACASHRLASGLRMRSRQRGPACVNYAGIISSIITHV